MGNLVKSLVNSISSIVALLGKQQMQISIVLIKKNIISDTQLRRRTKWIIDNAAMYKKKNFHEIEFFVKIMQRGSTFNQFCLFNILINWIHINLL